MNDLELLKTAKSNGSAFTEIYRKYVSKVYKYCYFNLNFNKEEAEDITSQTFLLVLEKLPTIKLDKSHNYSLLPYIYTVARHLFIKQWQKSGKLRSLDELDMETIPGDTNFEDTQINECTADDIMRALAKVDLLARDIVYLKIYEDMKFNEIAAELNLKESAVKMRYYRAIEYVTNKLKKD